MHSLKVRQRHRIYTINTVTHGLNQGLAVGQSLTWSSVMHTHSPRGHVLPQAPQCRIDLLTSVQAPLHSSCPSGHLHTPPSHTCERLQRLPHVPQLLVSLCTATQAPQSVRPWLQMHRPATQACFARQTLLQLPQLALLVRMSTQRPAQKVWLAGLGHWQAPAVHCWEKGHTCNSNITNKLLV
jgi:hypothetical protein